MKIYASVQDVLSEDLEFLYEDDDREKVRSFPLHMNRLSRIRKLHKRNKKNPKRMTNLQQYRLTS